MHSGPGGLRRQPAMAVTAQRGEQGHPSKSALHALRHKVCWLLCRVLTPTTPSLMRNTIGKVCASEVWCRAVTVMLRWHAGAAQQ